MLLHGVFKLAKRRKLILSNPSEDAERVSLEDAGIFNVLEPVEFEAVVELDTLTESDRELFGAFLSMAFYAGPRLGELRDLPWRNVDFA